MLLRRGCFERTTPNDLGEIVATQRAAGSRLVVHFHGGLVDRQQGLAITKRLTPIYERAGGAALFVLWQSGLTETLAGRLRAIAQENIFRQMLARLLQFTLAKVRPRRAGKRAIGLELPDLAKVYQRALVDFDTEPYAQDAAVPAALSKSEEQQVEQILLNDSVIQDETAAILRGLETRRAGKRTTRAPAAGASTTTLMSPEMLDELARDGRGKDERSIVASARIAKGALVSLKRVLSRLHAGRGHGVYCTVMEELLREFYLANAGAALWRQMKRDIEDSFGGDMERNGGSALLSLLAEGQADTPLLVGHSAGALFICNLLAHAEQLPPDRVFDVAMLAPACDFDAMDRALVRHSRRMRSLRIFAMRDEHECKDHLVPGIYPRSLLYFVSGALERSADWPLLGMERFHGLDPPYSGDSFPAIGRVRDELGARADSCVWSLASGAPGLRSQAVRHGDFDDDPETLASVAEMVACI